MKIQQFVIAAAIALEGVAAHPTVSHAHLHKLRLRDVLKRTEYDTSHVNWDDALKDVNWDEVFGKNGKSGKPAAPVSTAQAVSGGQAVTNPKDDSKPAEKPKTSEKDQTSSKSSSSSSSGSCVTAKVKRATAEQDGAIGNHVGNIQPESNCESSGKYSLTFANNGGSKKTYWLWNKNGGQSQSGMMETPAHTFDLDNGQKTTFTLQPNSYIGFSEACGRAATNGGVPNCNIGEASFNDQKAGGGSFYDVSMVTFNDITKAGGSPSKVPMAISADGYDTSSCDKCNYVTGAQNSVPGCYLGPNDPSAFHVTVTFT